jgi:hypothetical protein
MTTKTADLSDVVTDWQPAASTGWTLVTGREGEYWKISGRDCEVRLEKCPPSCDNGNYLARLFPRRKRAGDNSVTEGWPRYFFNVFYAKREIEAWMQKSNRQIAQADFQTPAIA